MRAILCESFGLPASLLLREVATPEINSNQVLIAVKACGVNFPDTLIIQNKYQFKPTLPFSPGGEVSGTIVAVGSNISNFKVGDRVLALCGWGGFADQLAVDASRVFPIPPDLSFVEAAATLFNYGTSYYALKNKANLQPKDFLLVMGAGSGVGLAAIELGSEMGATVIAFASTQEKLDICREKGAQHFILSGKDDLKARIKEITNGHGVDVIYDPVGGQLAETALRAIAWNGRYLVVGFASGEIPQIPFNLTLLKGCAVSGIFWGSFAEKEPLQHLQNMHELLAMLRTGKIKPHIHKLYNLADAATAIQDLMERKVVGKAIVITGDINESTSIKQIKPDEKIKPTEKQNQAPKPFVINELKNIRQYIGLTLGNSDWLLVSQEMINDFAAVTKDFQWVHTDQEKAKKMLLGGKNIAHGYLTLSLVSQFLYQLIKVDNVHAVLNYGINKARFISPVTAGDKIRLEASIGDVEEMENGHIKIFFNCIITTEGVDKPAYIAELISLVIP